MLIKMISLMFHHLLGLYLFQPFKVFSEHILCPLLGLFWKIDRGSTDKINGGRLIIPFPSNYYPGLAYIVRGGSNS